MTHTPDTEPINDKASEIVAFLHLMHRHDLSGALTRERLTTIRMITDLVKHRRRLFEALETALKKGASWESRQEAADLLDELRLHVAKEQG